MRKTKKTYDHFNAVSQAFSITLILNYHGITDRFKRSGDSLSEPWALHDAARPLQFGISISSTYCQCKHGDAYAGKYVPIGHRTPSTEELATRRIAKALKLPTEEAIALAAPVMAALIDGPCWLVPVPASNGSLTANLALARAIAALVPGARVKCAVARAHTVESGCQRRLRGLAGLTIDEHAIIRTTSPMRPLPVYFVDNVITTGTTVAACRRALGWGHGLAYADASTPGNTRSFHSEIPAPVDYRQSSPTTPRAEGQVLREADGGSQLFTHDLMEKEWKAWQRVVSEWPGDINDPRFKRLVKAIQLWGEWLARLREKQRLDLRQGALTKAQVAYEKPQHTNASLCGRSSVRSKERQMT